jgi:hypothetical protein
VGLSFPWEATSFSETEEFIKIICNPKVHYRVLLSPPLVPVLSQITPVHTTPPYFPKINLNIFLPRTSRSSWWSLCFWFPHQNSVCIPIRSRACYILPVYPPWLNHSSLAKDTISKVLHYAFFSNFLLFHPSSIQISFSAPRSKIPSMSIHLSIYVSICLSVYLSIHPPIYLWLYSPLLDLGHFFSFVFLDTVGRTPWTGEPSVYIRKYRNWRIASQWSWEWNIHSPDWHSALCHLQAVLRREHGSPSVTCLSTVPLCCCVIGVLTSWKVPRSSATCVFLNESCVLCSLLNSDSFFRHMQPKAAKCAFLLCHVYLSTGK